MGFRITNWKNTNFQKLEFFFIKINGRALTGIRALIPILNTQNLAPRALNSKTPEISKILTNYLINKIILFNTIN